MQLHMPGDSARGYKSGAQQVRVVSEAWAASNLYCPSCASPSLSPAPANTEAIDYTCPTCESPFQLKSQSRPLGARIVDAGYDAMCRSIREDRTPNLFVLHYERSHWEVRNLLLVPRFVFSISSIERRKPLGPSARRHGWVGCNILLGNILADARIPVVTEGKPSSPASVRQSFARLRPLENLKADTRGWTLDVLNIVRGIGRGTPWRARRDGMGTTTGTPWCAPTSFTLADVYACEDALARLHPDNYHVRDKIRQQLQILRDMGFIEFLGRGVYRLM